MSLDCRLTRMQGSTIAMGSPPMPGPDLGSRHTHVLAHTDLLTCAVSSSSCCWIIIFTGQGPGQVTGKRASGADRIALLDNGKPRRKQLRGAGPSWPKGTALPTLAGDAGLQAGPQGSLAVHSLLMLPSCLVWTLALPLSSRPHRDTVVLVAWEPRN